MLWDILNEVVFWIADGIEDFMEERNIKLNVIFRIMFNIFLVVITGGLWGFALAAKYVSEKKLVKNFREKRRFKRMQKKEARRMKKELKRRGLE